MTGPAEQFDPIQLAAQLGGATDPTLDEVAHSAVFAEPEPEPEEASPVTGDEADRAALIEEGEHSEDVPGPYAGGEPVIDSP